MTTGRTNAQPETPGETAGGGRYLVERRLGKGGMASVYAVVDTASGQHVALKRLLPEAETSSVPLFEREYQTLASLRHPCIVEAYDYGVDANGPYYTMELVEGRDLSGYAPIAWRSACAYLRDAAAIVGLLHARRLLHRDLSPRNLMDCSGRLKLIDFGALADFGRPSEVAGTPPFVPPEALRGEYLDQRADLFALGALGYWLVTGSHAYPARHLTQLEALWTSEPPPASEVVRGLNRERLEPPPPAFDELLRALLSSDRNERIASTSELIDRLNVLAGLAPEETDLAVAGYLGSSAFVGRESELHQVALAVTAARSGSGQVLVIEGAPGVGRSRFLREVALGAKLDGAIAISSGPHTRTRAYALAAQLLEQLSRALPSETRAASAPYEQALAPVRSLSAPAGDARAAIQAAGDQRARLQHALLATFSEVASTHPIVLLIDDLDQADEESSALIAALCHRAPQLQLSLIVGLPKPLANAPSSAVTSLLGVAQVLTLPPLRADQTHTLLRSVFGDVPYLARLAERLHRAAEGNPAHCLELAQHLVQTGEARYVEGSWSLPSDLRLDALPASRPEGVLLRLTRLSPAASALARAMSVSHAGSWTAELAADAAAISRDQAETLIATLIREKVLRSSESGLGFDHDVLPKRLLAELSPDEQREIHRRLGLGMRQRSAPRDLSARLAACIHFLHAGDLRRAFPALKQALSQCVEGDPAHIGLHAPAFEEIHGLLRQANQPEHALAGPLAMLAVAGYFADRRYALRYGAEAIRTLEHVLKLSWAHALAPWLGRKLALFVTLLVAAVGCAVRGARSMSVAENVRGLLLAASTLAGTAAICMDPDRAARYAQCLAPFTALGPDHAASVVHDFTALMSLQGRDRTSRCVDAYHTMLRRLDKEHPIRDMTDVVRASYYAGVHLTLGVFLVRRDDTQGLALADKLEQFSPLYAMGADHLRSNYCAARGDLEQAQYWRRRMEIHAIQLGTAWQVETWAPVDVINIAMRLHDATAMKRATDELAHVCTKVPSLAVQHRYARIGYLVLSGQYHEALALGAECNEPPYSHNGWMRTQGTLARAYNALGRHSEARALCTAAIAEADPDEFDYVVPNLGLQIELALAEAGLGEFREAQRQLQRLIDKHTPNACPVTLGSLCEARARVALLEKNTPAARQHLERAEGWIAPLGIASLTRRIRALSRELGTGADPVARETLAPPGPAPEQGTSKQVALRARGAATDRLQRSLEIVRGLCGVKQVCLLLPDDAGTSQRLMYTGEAPPPEEMVHWSKSKLEAFDADDEGSTVLTKVFSDRSDAPQKVFGALYYRSRALWLPSRAATSPVAMLVLASTSETVVIPEPDSLRALVSQVAAIGKVS